MSKTFVLAIFFAALNIDANQRIHVSNGVEFEVNGTVSLPDPILGNKLVPNSKCEMKKYINGKLYSTWTMNIGANGLRVTSDKNLNRKKHLLLIDGSFIFGDNLNDNETIPFIVNKKSKEYEAYAIAFTGYGSNQSWLTFKSNELKDKVTQKKGRAIIFSSEPNIRRFFGTIEHLAYNSNHPRIVENMPGEFVHVGTFEKNGDWLQQFISTYCVPYTTCRDLAASVKLRATKEQFKTMGRVFKSIAQLYRAQFDVESIQVSWIGPDAPKELVEESGLEFVTMSVVSKAPDGHPSNEDNHRIVDFLFKKKMIE